MPIPYSQLETLFLDAGNTLISVNFERVVQTLAHHNIQTTPTELERSEAAARPHLSRAIEEDRDSTEGEKGFRRYVTHVLQQLPATRSLSIEEQLDLVSAITPELFKPGQSLDLWNRVIPGVPEALARLRDSGRQLIVVSNSDGSIEGGLQDMGLAPYFTHILDSALVGVEKPDPRIFEEALRLAGTAPDRALHVGDIYDVDVVGAQNAGAHALLVDPFDDWPHEGGPASCERIPHISHLCDALGV